MTGASQLIVSRLPEIGTAEMLHRIRAAVRTLQSEARQQGADDRNAVTRHLSRLLAQALQQELPLDIAVILGSAAELGCYPDDHALERCTCTIQRRGGKAMRAVVWAVRHRCARASAKHQRFAVDCPSQFDCAS